VSQLDIEQRIETTKIKHTESDLIDSDKRLHNDDITYLSGMISVIKNNKNTDNMLQETSTDNKISKMTRKKKIVVTIILLILILLIGIVLMLIFIM
jgi:ATP-dependent Zn protease